MLWLIWTRSEKGNKQVGFHLGGPALQKPRCCIIFHEETELVCKLWYCWNFYPWAFVLCVFVLSTHRALKPAFCRSVSTPCKMLHTYIFSLYVFPSSAWESSWLLGSRVNHCKAQVSRMFGKPILFLHMLLFALLSLFVHCILLCACLKW